jgi:hypothetical protein
VIQNGNRRRRREGTSERRLLQLAGNPSTIEEAVRIIVEGLLADTSTAPTDLESLKPKLNIANFCAEDIPFSGELRREGKQLKIIYSKHLSGDRRRFTIAHEMGHAIFERTGRNCPRSGVEIEKLCDMLAAEILMPKDAFLDRVGSTISLQTLFELKKTFEVSLSAVAFRCFELKRASTFELDEERRVKWGCGLIKPGSLRLANSGLQLAIEEALEHSSGTIEVFFSDLGETQVGELEWSKKYRNGTLFLLRRHISKPVAVTSPY